MRLHGGSLVVEEGIENGSAVHLYLPVDERTAHIVQRYRAVEARVDEMLAKGMTPTVYCFSKKNLPPWQEAIRAWRSVPAINPTRSDSCEGSTCLWPLTDEFALALTTRFEFGMNPETFYEAIDPAATRNEGIASAASSRSGPAGRMNDDRELRAGWAAAPREGAHLKELVSVALGRMERAVLVPLVKGDVA